MMFKEFRHLFIDCVSSSCAIKRTIVQTCAATLLATLLATTIFATFGQFYDGIWFQIIATLIVTATVAPIFLYPSFRARTRLLAANKTIAAQAATDHLTGLPNMLALSNELQRLLNANNEHSPFAIHFLDVNRFKQINDSLGPNVGNEVLIQVGRHIADWVGDQGFVARFGGDEFVVIQYAIANQTSAQSFARALQLHVSQRYTFLGNEVSLAASVGTALSKLHGSTPEQLLKVAGLALHHGKDTGHANSVFEPRFSLMAANRHRIESILRETIDVGHLTPYFHSIVDAKNPLKIKGFETLSRIELPDGSVVNPEEFIPIAEETGQILELGAHVLRQACLECASWQPDLFVAVNVSPVQLISSDFLATVRSALKESGLAPYRLELEITESVLINDLDQFRTTLEKIRALGVHIALDDFGAGYCGLHYLRQFEVDKIKIDKSIIGDTATVELSRNIIKSISLIAKDIDIKLVAEGVSDIKTAEYLSSSGHVDQFQGYMFSKPVNADDARRMQLDIQMHAKGNNVIQLPVRPTEKS